MTNKSYGILGSQNLFSMSENNLLVIFRGDAMMQPVTAPRSLKEKQRKEREALILQAAEEVLAEKGYHETSVDEIAARVGIAKGTVYLHFASKEELVVALFERDMQNFLQMVAKQVDTAASAREKMEAILQVMYGEIFSKRIQLLYSMYQSPELRRNFGEKGCMRELWEELAARISSLLEEGKAAGEFDVTLPTPVMLLASLDQTIVSTAMPRVIAELQGFDRYTWVSTAYLLTSTVMVPIYGKLSDMFGRKPIFLFGIVVFLIGSALSGASQSMNELIAFRALQGIGAGALMPIAIAVVGDLFTPRERGKWQGVTGAVWGFSAIVGPTLGGWITENTSWRWVFYVNLPIGIIAMLVLIFLMPALRGVE